MTKLTLMMFVQLFLMLVAVVQSTPTLFMYFLTMFWITVAAAIVLERVEALIRLHTDEDDYIRGGDGFDRG
jgi:hypothetical protein